MKELEGEREHRKAAEGGGKGAVQGVKDPSPLSTGEGRKSEERSSSRRGEMGEEKKAERQG
eukprot:2867382-Rhodomonas_salina.1